MIHFTNKITFFLIKFADHLFHIIISYGIKSMKQSSHHSLASASLLYSRINNDVVQLHVLSPILFFSFYFCVASALLISQLHHIIREPEHHEKVNACMQTTIIAFRAEHKIDCELFIWCIWSFMEYWMRIWILCHWLASGSAVVDLLLIFDKFYSSPKTSCVSTHFIRFLNTFSPRK